MIHYTEFLGEKVKNRFPCGCHNNKKVSDQTHITEQHDSIEQEQTILSKKHKDGK